MQTYSSVFSEHEYDPIAAEEILQYVPNLLEEEDLDHLITPITKQEVVKAIQSCSKNSAPGLDGLPYEFYHTFLGVISDDLVEVFNHYLFKDECLTSTMRKVVITLIPKKGDTGYLNNWRPISLQNCDSKILAKIHCQPPQTQPRGLNRTNTSVFGSWSSNSRPHHTRT